MPRKFSGGGEIKLQVRRRETPTLPIERRPQIVQSYFRSLPFAPTDIVCLALAEILPRRSARVISEIRHAIFGISACSLLARSTKSLSGDSSC